MDRPPSSTSSKVCAATQWEDREEGEGVESGRIGTQWLTSSGVIHKLTNRHPVLRSVVAVNEGKPQIKQHGPEVIDPEVRVVYRETTAIAEGEVTKMLRRPFDLQNEPPARWLVLRDAQVFRVYLVGHHIIVDGSSMSLISREFLDLVENADQQLPPLSDFSHMHMIEVSQRTMMSSTPFWQSPNLTALCSIECHDWYGGLHQGPGHRSRPGAREEQQPLARTAHRQAYTRP